MFLSLYKNLILVFYRSIIFINFAILSYLLIVSNVLLGSGLTSKLGSLDTCDQLNELSYNFRYEFFKSRNYISYSILVIYIFTSGFELSSTFLEAVLPLVTNISLKTNLLKTNRESKVCVYSNKNIYTIQYHTMFTFNKIISKGSKLPSLFSKKSYGQEINPSNDLKESQYDLALSITKYFHTIFAPTPVEFLCQLNNVKNGLIIYKMFAYAKTVPNPFLAKKLFQITFKKELLVFPKANIIEMIKILSKNNIKNLQLENAQEKTSTSGVYEIYTGILFTNQLKNIHSIIYKTENPLYAYEEIQKRSVSMTGQKNCDLEVTFQTELGYIFNSLMDVLIGKNKYYKGNLIQTRINNIKEINENISHIIQECKKFSNDLQFSPYDKKKFIFIKQKIDSIHENSNITPQNKTLLIQEQLVELVPIIRNYNKNYNPNFIVFFEERNLENEKFLDITKHIQKIFPESFSSHTSNDEMEPILKKSLTIFLKNYYVDWKLLSPTEREDCLGLMKKLNLDFYIEIITKLKL